MRCRNCHFWDSAEPLKATNVSVIGTCRALPPTLDAEEYGVWPMTNEKDWCGRFKNSPAIARKPGRPVGDMPKRVLETLKSIAPTPALARRRSTLYGLVARNVDVEAANFYRIVADLVADGAVVPIGKNYWAPSQTPTVELD